MMYSDSDLRACTNNVAALMNEMAASIARLTNAQLAASESIQRMSQAFDDWIASQLAPLTLEQIYKYDALVSAGTPKLDALREVSA